MPQGYMQGCTPYKFMHEAIAGIERTIKDEVYMCIHQRECQDDNVIVSDYDEYPVHTRPEILFIVKHDIYGIAIR